MDLVRDRTVWSHWIGRPLPRIEDEALLRGHGQFIDDLDPSGCLHIQFLRSERSSGKIAAIDTSAARLIPGVVDIMTGADVAGFGQLAVNPLLDGLDVPPSALMAFKRIESVGQPLAAVVATTPVAALDAIEALQLKIEEAEPGPLDAGEVFNARWLGGNIERAFRQAARIVDVRLAYSRLAPAALEPRRALVSVEPDGNLVAWLGTQTPHRARTDLARILCIPEGNVRVIAPDIGGAFGGKASLYPEDVVVAYAALRLHRPVKWCATRGEDFLAATQGRGARARGELALTENGSFLGLRAQFEFPLGAWLPFSAVVPARNAGRILPGPYDITNVDITVRGLRQRTAAVGIYRGAGRPEAAMLMERLIEQAARACDVDPAELRKRNLVQPDRFPFASATGETIDSGNYPLLLAEARERCCYDGLLVARDQRRAAGEICGVGLALYVEPSGQGWESAAISLAAGGKIIIATGATSQGQGRETAYAQVVADAIGVDPSHIIVRHSDTSSCPPGIGALASRSTAIGGSALLCAAEKFREAARACAADLMQQPADQISVTPCGFEAVGAERRMEWCELAAAANSPGRIPPGLATPVVYHAEGEAWSSGCCVAGVAIDAEIGSLRIEKLVWIDDAGVVVNPLLVRGQILGGMAQGLGEALLERIVYDADGQILTGSFMDYALPRASDIPEVELAHIETPSPFNLLGAKGVGEAGCIGVPAAIVNATLDALAPYGVASLDMPLTSEKIWRALNGMDTSNREGRL